MIRQLRSFSLGNIRARTFLETTTTTDNHPAKQTNQRLHRTCEQQKDDGTSATESVIVEPQPRMLAAPYATSLPDDPNIIQSTRCFKSQLEMQQVF